MVDVINRIQCPGTLPVPMFDGGIVDVLMNEEEDRRFARDIRERQRELRTVSLNRTGNVITWRTDYDPVSQTVDLYLYTGHGGEVPVYQWPCEVPGGRDRYRGLSERERALFIAKKFRALFDLLEMSEDDL